ncbi:MULTISPECIES: methyltransferase domain-containing protein [unclassified Leptolyngbya]|uniref:class I SAM-dependent methyltransferase n=1 Tax=unclassified Leptolyngbya TaxID=2650499 RepID=UPI00168423DA|nr:MULTISPECIES: methyltransferase domain-containing protein [unclassified Leptolyngbya]MBD1910925.1 methyltransferase domain-containing protein [Leptolyngbya sp. FACHB-8]MBD2154970.1 methyltransferase domain-containing protein [Leptolyngbya sp. FACHB-16]
MPIEQVIATYDHGAAEYEAIMQRYWHVEREPFISTLNLQPGQTVLDAAVGTGLNLPAYPAGVQVTGIDLSEGMLQEARKKNIMADLTLKVANLENLDFADNSFDAAASGFTLCVVANPVRALQEILRVTKSNALIAILDYCKSQNPEVQKWQALIEDAALNIGFPTGKIKWNALMDYDKLIYQSNLAIEVVQDHRIESPNPFSCGCQFLLRNTKS